MLGSFGDVVFEASADRIRTFSGLSVSRTARFATHELYGRRPTVEYLGPSLESASMTIRLDASWGLNPAEELKKLKTMLDGGAAHDLIIGDRVIGAFVLEGLTEAHNVIDGRGRLLVAEVSLSMKGA